MTHKMILVSADLKTIYKVVVLKRKNKASEVQRDERLIRIQEAAGSSPARSSNDWTPPEAA